MNKTASVGAKVMCGILSSLEAIEEMYEHMHWKASGPNSYGDHLLYDRLYNETSDEVDGVAEKAIGVFGPEAIGPVKNTSMTADMIQVLISDENTSKDFPELAIKAEKGFVELVSESLKILEKENELTNGIDNLLQGIVDLHEGHLYLLQQRAKEANVNIAVKLFKLAYHLDLQGLHSEADIIEEAMKIMKSRVGLTTKDMISLADQFDSEGNIEIADCIDEWLISKI